MVGYEDAQRRAFFERSEIDGRYIWLDRTVHRLNETIDEMSERFRIGALELGEAAARRALERADWAISDVDFIATTTCTGRLTPSLDMRLAARLGCRRDVQRVHVGDTGCASAMVALQQAWNHLHAFPAHRALVISVEVCSAAYFLDDRLETAVAHAIFADGAGAVALACSGEGPRIITHRTLVKSDHLDAMGFDYPQGRPRIILSKDVRQIGPVMFAEMAALLTDFHGLKRADIRHWVLHSAGRGILERASRLLELTDEQTRHTRKVLRTFGNMGSATILFVLDEMLREESPLTGEWGLMIGLGPGFAVEGALLTW